MDGIEAKNSTASSTSICSTSPMLLPRQLTASVSALKRWPWQLSQGTFTSGRKLISMVRRPWPSQAAAAAVAGVEGKARRRVAARLGLQRLGEELADRVPEADVGGRAGARRLADRRLVDLEHAVDRPASRRCRPGPASVGLAPRLLMNCRLASSTSRASVLLPEPLTPVTATSRCSGTATSSCCRLCSAAPRSCSAGAVGVHRPARLQRVPQRVGQQAPGHRLGAADRSATVPCGHQRAAALAGAGADVDQVVGAADRVLVVLHHHQRVALVARASAARSAGCGCRAGAGRWSARRARSTRPAGCCPAAPPGGCAAPRRRSAWARRGPASGSPGPPPRGTRSRLRDLGDHVARDAGLAHRQMAFARQPFDPGARLRPPTGAPPR